MQSVDFLSYTLPGFDGFFVLIKRQNFAARKKLPPLVTVNVKVGTLWDYLRLAVASQLVSD